MASARPLIGIPADRRLVGAHPFHMVGEKYGPAHHVTLEPGGMLRAFASGDRIPVNSLHSQGIDRLGPELEVEARAPDGVIEAFRVRNAQRFALAVQWHPEWKVMSNPFSRALFAAFGEASRERAAAK